MSQGFYSIRRHRISRRSEFAGLYAQGKSASFKNLKIRYLPADDGEVRFAFVLNRKTGNAVRRNRLRRIMRAVMNQQLKSFKQPVHFLMHYFPLRKQDNESASHSDADTLAVDCVQLLNKAGLLC